MGFDFPAFYERLQDEVRTSTDLPASMGTMMKWGEGQISHPDWARLATFDAVEELRSAKIWLPRVLKRAPSPFPVRGAFLGLGGFQDQNGTEFADLYFGLMSTYDPADTESQWLYSKPRHYPEDAYLGSKALHQGGLICNRKTGTPGLGTPGHICFSTSFAALILRHTLDGDIYRLLGGTAPIGVVTGFDSGDLMRLGEMTSEGFVPNKNAMV